VRSSAPPLSSSSSPLLLPPHCPQPLSLTFHGLSHVLEEVLEDDGRGSTVNDSSLLHPPHIEARVPHHVPAHPTGVGLVPVEEGGEDWDGEGGEEGGSECANAVSL